MNVSVYIVILHTLVKQVQMTYCDEMTRRACIIVLRMFPRVYSWYSLLSALKHKYRLSKAVNIAAHFSTSSASFFLLNTGNHACLCVAWTDDSANRGL